VVARPPGPRRFGRDRLAGTSHLEAAQRRVWRGAAASGARRDRRSTWSPS
jgi:hypothetical protein